MTRQAFRIVLAFILALLFLGQGITAPFHNDEEAEPAGIVLEIVKSGRWLVPVDLQGQLSRKPPLFYWLAAIIARARGRRVDEAGARSVSLLAAAALATVVMEFARASFGLLSGCLAYLFLLGSYGFASRAAFARTDMLFTFLVFTAYSLFYPLARCEQSTWRAVLVGVLLGLGILTKGPLALVLCLVGLLIYFGARGQRPLRAVNNRQSWLILLIAATLAGSWYIPAFLRAPALLRIQLLEENLGHFLPARLGGTGEAARPIYYIWLRFIGSTLPLNIYLITAFPRILQGRKWGDMILYQSALVVGSLTFFSLANSKRDDYILVALPSFATVLGGLVSSASAAGSGQLIRIANLIASLLLLGLGIAGLGAYGEALVFPELPAKLHSNAAAYAALLSAADHYGRIGVTTLLIVGASLVGLHFALRHKAQSAAISVALAQLAAIILWIGLLTPALARQRTLKVFVLGARRIVANHPVMIVGLPNYEVSYYFGRGIPPIPKDFQGGNRVDRPEYLLAWSDQLTQLRRFNRYLATSVVSVSHETSGHRRMLLLSIGSGLPGERHASSS